MSSTCPTLREEFRVKKFLFSGVHTGRFYNFHWRLPPFIFLLYRLCLAIYVDFWLIYFGRLHTSKSTTSEHGPQPWSCYLTVWTYTVLALFLTIYAVIVLMYYLFHPSTLFQAPSQEYHANLFHELSSSDGYRQLGYEQIMDDDYEMEIQPLSNMLPWYLKLVWILQNIVFVAAVIVTMVFFVFLLPQMKGVSGISLENLQLHALNTVIVVVESLVSAVPHRLLHIVYCALYALVYVLFSVFYWVPDHAHVMYPNVLDWNQPAHTVGMICLIAFVFFPLLQMLYHLIYRLKIFILQQVLSV
ncbi:protein rolling stone-like [Gigantopelta aegis]|uniref:protein rolling stone-like n=1 Tax=Gigantopelta aegis TaxID=1735272 RepID=UPI001B88C2A2|nr:protein rolling stone-like [Gigantopelta aegis]XP_041347474.1 protein rolling stone-like [Gigantopelta aegis]